MIEPRAIPLDEDIDPNASAIPFDNPYAVNYFRPHDLGLSFGSYVPPVARFHDVGPAPRPGFPERIAFDASGIMGALDAVTHAPDALAGVLRYIPGVAGFGDFLGDVGEKLGESPLGKPLGAFGGGVGTLAAETLGAVVGRVGDVAQELGTIASQKEARLDDPLRLFGTVFAGKTGARAFDFSRPIDQKVWEDMPQDIMDTINLVGIMPALKVAGLVGKVPRAKQFLSGLTKPTGSSLMSTPAMDAGRNIGRGLAATYGAGLAVEAVTPRFGDNEVTRSIMGTRIINDESPWRFPFDIAASLPLDVFALTRAAASAKQSAWMTRQIFGDIKPAIRVAWPQLDKGIDLGLVTRSDADWMEWQAERIAAAKKKVEAYNTNAPGGAQLKDYSDLPKDTFDNLKADIDEWRRTDPSGLRDAAVREMREWQGMGGVDEANQMYWAHEFATIGRAITEANPNAILGVADMMKAAQLPLAIRALDDFTEWTAYEQGLFRKEFPAFSKDLDNYLKADMKGSLRAHLLDTADKSDVVVPAPAELGALLIHRDRLATRLFKGEAVGPEWRKTLDDIKAIRDDVAKDAAKRRDGLTDMIARYEAEIPLAKTQYDADVIHRTIQIAREKLKEATMDYYRAFTAGSRWTVKDLPSGNVMRLTDEIPTRPSVKGRTKMGEIYDALFGHVKNSELGRKSLQQVMDAAAATPGVDAPKMEELMDELRKIIKRFTIELGSAEFRLFASVWHLPAFVINNAAKELKMPLPVGYKNWSEVFYRAYPGPFKILSEAVGLKLPDVPYNAFTQAMFHTVGRSLYGTFRFTMDPRFILLNFSEADILRAAGAKRGTPEGDAAERLYRLIQKLDKEVGDTGALEMGERRGRLAAEWAASRRPDELWDAVARVIKDHPANEDVLRKYGVRTPDDLAKFLDKALGERIAAFDGLSAATADEAALARRIKELEADPTLRTATERPVDEMRDDLAEKIRRRQWAEAQSNDKWRPELQPFFDAMVENDIKLSKAASRTFRGNPDRSAIERAMNSYLLYWPLSYQLSRGKLLAEFMFSKALGYRTGSAGAQSWLELRQMHEYKLQNDPEYAQFFIDNKDLLFVMQQMIPLTPEDVGVTLSPMTRAPIRALRGESESKIYETLNNIGPLYTNDLLKRIVAEQSKPGGMWGRFIDGATE